jgi:hypothetical protein
VSKVDKKRFYEIADAMGVDHHAFSVKFQTDVAFNAAIFHISQRADEVDRLSHLHDLDHSLADQWQAKNERLERETPYRIDEAERRGYRKAEIALGQENAKLREALTKIASCEPRVPGDVVDIARRALIEAQP